MQVFCYICAQAPMDCRCIMGEPMECPPMPRGVYHDYGVDPPKMLRLPVPVVQKIHAAMCCLEPCRICGGEVMQGDEVWAGWSSCNTTRLAHEQCWASLPGSMDTKRLLKKRVTAMMKRAVYK